MGQAIALITLAVVCLGLTITCVWLATRVRRLNDSMQFQFRQHAERHLKRDQSMQELTRRVDTYIGVCVKMGDELQTLQQLAAPLPDRLSKLEQSDPTMISYLQASRLVTLGATVWKAPPPAPGEAAPSWMLINPNPAPPQQGPPPPTRRPVLSVVAIVAGLKPDDRVIVDGLQKVRPGAPAAPEEWNMTPPAPAPAK